MKIAAYSFIIVLLAVMLTAGCNDSIFTKEVPGQPLFHATPEYIDFGRIAVNANEMSSVEIANLGPRNSKLYLYYYLEGDPAFKFYRPNAEVELQGGDDPYVIGIEFRPERNGEVEGYLVLYSSEYPLSTDLNVKTHKIHLTGGAGVSCTMNDPGVPKQPLQVNLDPGNPEIIQ